MKRKTLIAITGLTFVFLLVFMGCRSARVAEKPEDFYRGKTITIIVPFAAGGGQDVQARLTAPYLAKYTGATSGVVENIEGGAGMKGMNSLYTTAEPDGLKLGTFPGNTMMLNQFLGKAEVKYDIPNFSYIGRMYIAPWGIGMGANVPGSTPSDLRKLPEFKVGISTLGMQSLVSSIFAYAFDLDNTKIISGYGGTKEVAMAATKGEVHSLALTIGPLQMYEKQGLMKLFCVMDEKRWADAPDVPTIFEVAERAGKPLTAEKAKWVKLISTLQDVERVIAGPPNIPEDRLKFLRDAFIKTCRDTAYQKDMKEKGDAAIVGYAHGEEVQKAATQLKMPETQMAEVKHFTAEKYFK